MEFRSRYWGDAPSKQAFLRFLKSIHGLDLTRWDASGHFDTDYTPFSFFQDGEIISSVCLYLLEAQFLGKRTKVAQISGVGTDPSYRGQGLNRELTQRALDWAKGNYDCLFLFSDEGARGFYQKMGFEERQDYFFSSKVEPGSGPSKRRDLDLRSPRDVEWLLDLAERREPASNEFSSLQTKLLMFHLLYDSSLTVRRVEDPELAIVIRELEDRTEVLDVLGTSLPTFEAWYPSVAREAVDRLDFLLPVDRLRPPAPIRKKALGNHAFVRPEFPILEPVFPATIFA